MKDVQMKKKNNAKRMMLWFGIVSLTMTFAGLTSAYVVSKSRPDWPAELDLPDAFTWSTLVIIISSLSLIAAFRTRKQKQKSLTTGLVIITFLLGVIFIYLQFAGFQSIVDQGYYFTGESSSVKSSYIYILVILHLIHVGAGLISLTVMLIRQLMGKYDNEKRIGFELAATFWHFVDVLWILLFLFLTFFR